MSIRTRLTLVAAAAVALAIVASSIVVYVIVKNEVRDQVDTALKGRGETIRQSRLKIIELTSGKRVLEAPAPLLGPNAYVQLVAADGETIPTRDESGKLPPDRNALRVAREQQGETFENAEIGGTNVRVFMTPIRDDQGNTYALEVARPLSELNHTLRRVSLFLILIAGGGVAIAFALGLGVSQAALLPVRRLTHAAETVRDTGDLSQRIEVRGDDELSRLASSFNAMLAALEEAARSQRQLVSDASHELRTPLTSLRTNIEVLARDSQMPPAEREKLLHDVVAQLAEMTALINELVELARGDQQPHEAEDVRLDLLVSEVLERARRDYPSVEFAADLQPSEVHGVPSTIARAVSNLLDNAAKWSPPGANVEVTVRHGDVIVRDHGPGIDETDLPYVFDRFYRAPAARNLPGSGLGLAIVKQVADAHGGAVCAERVDGGGTRVKLELPTDAAAPTPDGARDMPPAGSEETRSERTPA